MYWVVIQIANDLRGISSLYDVKILAVENKENVSIANAKIISEKKVDFKLDFTDAFDSVNEEIHSELK